MADPWLWGLVAIAVFAVLAFDFTNGFHDASNMIATLIASRAMTPAQSVVLIGLFTFLGPVLGGTAVANTLGGFVDLSGLAVADSVTVILCGVLGAITWNVVTWRFGLPSSSSHALVGALVGVVLLAAGSSSVVWGGRGWSASGELTGVAKIAFTLFTSPLAGFLAGFVLLRLLLLLLRRASPAANHWLRRGQLLTAALLAFAHGTNDAQKGMGIITLLLVLSGVIDKFSVPLWVVAASATTITAGTVFGGWSIVRTVGFGIYKLRPIHGFSSQLTSACVVLGASMIGGPVSTTHVVSSSIMGVGAAERPKSVRWGTAGRIGFTWIITLPCSALLGAGLYFAASWFSPGPVR